MENNSQASVKTLTCMLAVLLPIVSCTSFGSPVDKRQATVVISEDSPYGVNEICCQASGDPHYISFDDRRFDFMGSGTYLMAGNCCGSPRLSVYGNNVHRYGLNSVTYLDSVTLYIFGYSITLGQGRSVQVNGLNIPVRRLPYVADSFRIYNFRRNFVCVNTVWGLRTCFNGGSLTRVCYPATSRHFRAFDGLCNATSFRNPVNPPPPPGPGIPVIRELPQWPPARPSIPCCDPIDVTRPEYCGLLIDGNGPLRNCIVDPRLNSLGFYTDCMFDVCSFSFNSTVAALLARESVQNYVDMCQIILNTDITL